MTPTKRSNGQCTCYRALSTTPNASHDPDCPALYPLQPQPGDAPDTLTKLTRKVRHLLMDSPERDGLLALISEAAEELAQWKRGSERSFDEYNALAKERDDLKGRLSDAAYEADRLRSQRNSLQTRLTTSEEVVTRLSNKTTEALRMGQQQGRVELATELLGMRAAEALIVLEGIVNEDT